MSTLIPVIILGLISFAISAFVILRIVIPILPPSPLSRRVSPAEFGLPNFRSLSLADKSHLWFASLDMLALLFFVWQVATEYATGSSGLAIASDPASTIRIWLALTMRQSCLLVVAAVTLVHVRLGQSATFGRKHWMLWAPTVFLVVASTAVAAVFATSGFTSLFVGLAAYSSTLAILSTISLSCLIMTLLNIKRNLAALNDASDPWPPMNKVIEKPRPSFATEDIDGLRDGASWITSTAGSRRESMSNWSFSTHQTKRSGNFHPAKSSIPAKSSFWFNPSSTSDLHTIPPVPALPSPYGSASPTGEALSDPDPFRRASPGDLSPVHSHHPRDRLDSQTSWLTSTDGTRPTLSAWSFATQSQVSLPDPPSASRPVTPALSSAKVLGGYGYNPQSEVENGLASLATPGTEIDVSVARIFGWFVLIWFPLVLSLPYLFTVSGGKDSLAMYILLALSVTTSSPILALNIFCGAPIPIPAGLFDIRGSSPPSITGRLPFSSSETRFTHEYKRSASCSVTVVEGRRSGDVWLANGNAMESKTKLGRAMSMLAPLPKLSVLPPQESVHSHKVVPPLPSKVLCDENDTSGIKVNKVDTPVTPTSCEDNLRRKESKASSHYSGDESLAYASRIMIAQRHYSALAQTVQIPASPDRKSVDSGLLQVITTGIDAAHNVPRTPTSHIRCRSITALSVPSTPVSSNPSPSPPPSFPIPPTPPNVRAARLATLKHKKSFSSGLEFSFGAVDDVNEIDALTAGVLPILLPGLKVGKDMKITPGGYTPPESMNKPRRVPKLDEFGLPDTTPPAAHSTPARRRVRKGSGHKKNHMSLPSLGLGKDGVQSLTFWTNDVKSALETKLGQYAVSSSDADVNRRNTVWGGAESAPLMVKDATKLSRTMSTRLLGLSAEVPHEVEYIAKSSIATTLVNPPPSATSSVTLFDDFEAGLTEGPLAQSTPHESKAGKNGKAKLRPSKERPPPLPLATDQRNSRSSSIVYIKSNEPVSSATLCNESVDSSLSMFSRWPSKVVNPVASSKPKAKGLRPLSILKKCDENSGFDYSPKSTRPLTVSKKSRKFKSSEKEQNENTPPDAARTKGLKPLSLVRSGTAKERGKLRKDEVLPEFVIRPPSGTVNVSPYGYTFN